MLRLTRLTLTEFRNYPALTWRPGARASPCVTGPNGSGKTNLLEAISLLVPGRGLRSARIAELAAPGRRAAPLGRRGPLRDADGIETEIGTGTPARRAGRPPRVPPGRRRRRAARPRSPPASPPSG